MFDYSSGFWRAFFDSISIFSKEKKPIFSHARLKMSKNQIDFSSGQLLTGSIEQDWNLSKLTAAVNYYYHYLFVFFSFRINNCSVSFRRFLIEKA